MSTVRAALCFHNRGLVDQLGALAETASGRVILDFVDPINVSYILNDLDHFHVATRYGCLVSDVPPRVVLLYISGNQDERADQIIRDWDAIINLHKVRGTLAWSELAGFKTEFKASCDAELAEAARTTAREAETQRVRIEDLFGHGEPGIMGRPAATGPTLSDSLRRHRENIARHGGVVTRRQREAAEARREMEARAAAQWRIDWAETRYWYAPGPTGDQVAFFIDQMESKHLWETICWLVANYLKLFQQYNSYVNSADNAALAGKRWLRAQPAFRALVQEAVRRRITFPPDVFRYLREYMLGRDTTEITVAVPWEDPRLAHQAEELASFVDEPIHLPEEIDPTREFGRDYRDIDIDDT